MSAPGILSGPRSLAVLHVPMRRLRRMCGTTFRADAEGVALQGRALWAEESLFAPICLLDRQEGCRGSLQDAHRSVCLEGIAEPQQAYRRSEQEHECTHIFPPSTRRPCPSAAQTGILSPKPAPQTGTSRAYGGRA